MGYDLIWVCVAILRRSNGIYHLRWDYEAFGDKKQQFLDLTIRRGGSSSTKIMDLALSMEDAKWFFIRSPIVTLTQRLRGFPPSKLLEITDDLAYLYLNQILEVQSLLFISDLSYQYDSDSVLLPG